MCYTQSDSSKGKVCDRREKLQSLQVVGCSTQGTLRALWTWAERCHHGRKQYILWPGPVLLLESPQECRRHSEVTEATTKIQWKLWRELQQCFPPRFLCAERFTGWKKSTTMSPFRIPTAADWWHHRENLHRTPGPKSHHTCGTTKNISLLISDWIFKNSLRATYNKDRKTLKSKSKSTAIWLPKDFLSFLLFRKILYF